MATEIIQLPTGQNGNQNGGTSILPVANSGGGLFGNGQTNLADLFGFAIIASMFPNLFGGYGYGYGKIERIDQTVTSFVLNRFFADTIRILPV